jgi:hypothetical protein
METLFGRSVAAICRNFDSVMDSMACLVIILELANLFILAAESSPSLGRIEAEERGFEDENVPESPDGGSLMA